MKHQYGLRKGPIAWMARHGVAPNLLMALLMHMVYLLDLSVHLLLQL